MILAYVLICAIPFCTILLVLFALGLAFSGTYHAGKRVSTQLAPYLNNLKESLSEIQEKGQNLAERGGKIPETFEEISGRWAFITKELKEVTKFPFGRFTKLTRRITRFFK